VKRFLRTALLILLPLAFCHSGRACPVCYGANDSQMNAGMNTALTVMLGTTGLVLAVISAFFLMMWRRRRRWGAGVSRKTCIDEQGVLRLQDEKGIMEWNIT
jgi:heme/copper-type cytochrome/quinol oxidase subunit 2